MTFESGLYASSTFKWGIKKLKMRSAVRSSFQSYSHFTLISAYDTACTNKSNDNISIWNLSYRIDLRKTGMSWQLQRKRTVPSQDSEFPKIPHIPRKLRKTHISWKFNIFWRTHSLALKLSGHSSCNYSKMAISLEGGIKSTSPFELFHTSLGYNAMPTVLTQKPLDTVQWTVRGHSSKVIRSWQL